MSLKNVFHSEMDDVFSVHLLHVFWKDADKLQQLAGRENAAATRLNSRLHAF